MSGNDNTRHKSSVALVLIDVINHFDFPDSGKVLKNALLIAPRLAKLKERCRRAGIPAIYVNDNFGQWRSDARPFVEQVRPDDEDYFVLKPMHSAFFQTACASIVPSPSLRVAELRAESRRRKNPKV